MIRRTELFDKIEQFLRDKLSDINFDELCWGDLDSSCEDYMMEAIPDCYDVRSGASKCVLFFKEISNYGYCVKIPFLGFIESSDDEKIEFRFADDVIRYVHGMDITTSSWDYCYNEMLIGNLAEERGIGDSFARTFYLCHINGHPIYLAEKVDNTLEVPCGEYKSPTWNDSFNVAENFYNCAFSDSYVLAFFIDNYGLDYTKKLINFIEQYDIGDLYDSNIGFRDGEIKLIDYSDFNY